MEFKLCILSPNDEVRHQIEESLLNLDYLSVIGSTKEIEEAEYMLTQKKVGFLLVSPEGQQNQYAFIEKVTQDYPNTRVILLEDSLEEQTVHNALYLGVKDVLVKPYTPQKLVDSISRIQELSEKIPKSSVPEQTLTKKRKDKGKVITFFSTKGGVGKTFTAINFATMLSKKSDKRVALIDLDLDYGNSSLALNLPPKFTILDVVNDMQKIDKDLIESYMLPHKSGLKVLASNVNFNINEHIKNSQVKLIIELLTESFDYVIVDMPGKFHDNSMPALALADQLMVIVTPELSTIRNIKSLLSSLKELNFPSSKINLILNKYDRKGDIDLKDVSNTLNQNIDATIRVDHKRVAASLNKGVPFVIEYPNNAISKDIQKIVEHTTGEKMEMKKGLFNVFRKKEKV